jgi:hypothetical protein
MHRDNVIRASHGVTPAGTGSLARTVYPAGIAAGCAGISGEGRQDPMHRENSVVALHRDVSHSMTLPRRSML